MLAFHFCTTVCTSLERWSGQGLLKYEYWAVRFLLCCSAMYYHAFIELTHLHLSHLRSLVGINEVLVNMLKNVAMGDRMTRTHDHE